MKIVPILAVFIPVHAMIQLWHSGSLAFAGNGETCGSIAFAGGGETCGSIALASVSSGGGFSGGGCSYSC